MLWMIKGSKHSQDTKLKISKSNKGKNLGQVTWTKGRKIHYRTGKREHTEQTKQKMSEAAKGRWVKYAEL
jgi:NUMOD3 motif